MKIKIVLVILCLPILLFSCASSKLKKEAREQTSIFFSALRNDNELKLASIYPGFINFDSYYKSDSAKIYSVITTDSVTTVSVYNYYTNGFGKLSKERVRLFFKRDSVGNLKLYDSKGLADLREKDKYLFGVNTGCINQGQDTTDQQILIGLKKADTLLMDKALNVYIELKNEVTVSTWNWQTGFEDDASGEGIVKNNSNFIIPNLKYEITYKSPSGSTITSDDGYVCYDDLYPGDSKSFTFYTSYVGDASTASIELIFDDNLIFKYLEQKSWTGNEWKNYVKNDHLDLDKY